VQELIRRMDARTRFLLSALLFFNVTVFGCLCLLLTGKMAL
jgi:hypothetical protein